MYPAEHSWHHFRHGVLYAAAALTVACGSAPVRRDQPCSGQRVLIVDNHTASEIDVVAREGNTEKVLGMANPGRREFSLSDVSERAYFLAKRGTSYVSSGRSSAGARRQVEFRIDCR